MLVLLPPSEGKATGGGGVFDPAALSSPALLEARTRLMDALVHVCGVDPDAALKVLGLTEGLRDAVERNAALRRAGTLPAAKLYTGVLYDALDLATVPAAHRRPLMIFSGLWGVLRPSDRVPPYRLSAGVTLPGIGGIAAYWKRHLGSAVEQAAGSGAVLDLRSQGYAQMWTPTGELAARTASVRVLHERAGTRTVVSHFNKATKGRLVRDLLLGGAARVRTVDGLVTALRDLKYTIEEQAVKPGRPRALDVVVTEL